MQKHKTFYDLTTRTDLTVADEYILLLKSLHTKARDTGDTSEAARLECEIVDAVFRRDTLRKD